MTRKPEVITVRLAAQDKAAAIATAKSRGISSLSSYVVQRLYADPRFLQALRRVNRKRPAAKARRKP